MGDTDRMLVEAMSWWASDGAMECTRRVTRKIAERQNEVIQQELQKWLDEIPERPKRWFNFWDTRLGDFTGEHPVAALTVTFTVGFVVGVVTCIGIVVWAMNDVGPKF